MKEDNIAVARKIVAVLTAATAIITAIANCAEDINSLSTQKNNPLELESENKNF